MTNSDDMTQSDIDRDFRKYNRDTVNPPRYDLRKPKVVEDNSGSAADMDKKLKKMDKEASLPESIKLLANSLR